MESDVIARLRLRGRCKGLAPTLFCFFCLLGAPGPTLAQAPQLPAPVPTRLTYTVASGCPDEHFFRTAVSGYLGRRDPFTAAGEQSLDVKVSRTGGTFKATIVFVDVHGERHPDKNKLDDPDCTQLVETAALVVMKWIDPVIPPLPAPVVVPPSTSVDPAPAPKPPEPPSRSEIPPDDLPPVTPPPPPPSPPTPWILRFGASGWLDYGTVPGIAPGITASVGTRHGYFSGAIQGGWVPSASVALPGGYKDSVGQISGGLLLCGHVFGWFVPCIVGEAGEVQFSGSRPGAGSNGLLRGAGGLRVAGDFAIVKRRVFVEPAMEFLGAFGTPVYPYTLKLPNVNAALGAGLVFEFDPP